LREHLWDYPAKALKIQLDGKDLSGDYVLLEVMNIQHIGPSLHLAPDAHPADGLLEIVHFTASERHELANYLANRLEGHSQPPNWIVRGGRRLHLAWDGSDPHMDDKVWRGRDPALSQSPSALDVTMLRQALRFIV
jgi:diacylglycerol kinase family enzyme